MYFQNLPIEILIRIILNLHYEDVKEFSRISKYYHCICIRYQNDIYINLIHKYKIDYKDPGNFIYKMNNISLEFCMKNNKNKTEDNDDNINFDYKKIFDLYLKFYDKENIFCSYKHITSIPIYPKLKFLECNGNYLKELPYLPVLIELCCGNNQITELKMYDKLEVLICIQNKLRRIPKYPCLIELNCSMNRIKTLPEYPLLKILSCYNNNIKNLPCYPKLKRLNCEWNKLKSLSEYPLLQMLNCNHNKIKHLRVYPILLELYCEDNNLEYLPDLQSIRLLRCKGNSINQIPSYPKLDRLNCDHHISINKSDFPSLFFLNSQILEQI